MTSATLLYILTGLADNPAVHPAAVAVASGELLPYLDSLSELGRAQFDCVAYCLAGCEQNWREN